MSANGAEHLKTHKGLLAGTVLAVVSVCGLAWLMAAAGVDTLGALGPDYHRYGMLAAFNVHVLSGLLI